MSLALALFYRGGTLPTASAGLLIFGALALIRRDLGLLFVPLTAPLYLIPAMIGGVRTSGFSLPLHEAALLVVLATTLTGWIWRRATRYGETSMPANLFANAIPYAPHLLFLLSGVLGVLLAVERGPALIEFRRLIAEPLIFYGLLKSQIVESRTENAESLRLRSGQARTEHQIILNSRFMRIVVAFILGGAIVALVGLLQFAGLDLAWLFGTKQCFAASGQVCDNVVVIDGVRRATSVYGHPNNLGLYLGRVWPLAAVLAVAPLLARAENREPLRLRPLSGWNSGQAKAATVFFVVCSLLCLGGIAVSFSRGAWLGAVLAVAVLALGMRMGEWSAVVPSTVLRAGGGRWSIKWLIGFIVALAVVGGLALFLRGDPTSGSSGPRVLIWREALGYIRLHPLGIGLDQFLYYHDPKYGRSLIDPSLLNTSEVYAPHPHNLILDTWLRLGPLGLVAFAWLLARFFRAARASIPAALALGALAALVAALVHGLVDNFYFVPDLAFAFWLLLALVETISEWKGRLRSAAGMLS
jgi:putative inorganic carbon (HCO3(-)) transporter